MTRNDLADTLGAHGSASRVPILELRGVTGTVAASRSARRPPAWVGPGPLPPRDIDLVVRAGEIVGVLGDSGTDLPALARLAAGLVAPLHGERRLHATEGPASSSSRTRPELAVELIPAGPGAGLNPRRTVCDLVSEAPVALGLIRRHQRVEFAGLHLNRVGFDPSLMHRFAQQFTAEERIRIAIARAIAVGARLLVCDDPFADLDVPAAAALLNLLAELRESSGLAWLYLGRDPHLVGHLADRLLVLCGGRHVESGDARAVLGEPAHPYTAALVAGAGGTWSGALSCAPQPTADAGAGCPFHPLCPHADPQCRAALPPLTTLRPGREVACIRVGAPAAGTAAVPPLAGLAAVASATFAEHGRPEV